ncbi:type VI secretion protein VasK, partial [Enterobacter ludwigii]
MIKKKRISIWLIVAIIISVSAGLIWLNNPFVRLAGQEQKMMASLIVTAVCLGILLFDALFVRLWDGLVSKSFIQRFKFLRGMKPEQPEYEHNNNLHSNVVKEIHQSLRTIYNCNWASKIRVLIITGTASEVEQLTPGLTSQLWQEDRGTLLLWGGDLNTPADSAWLTALRKLRRRPVDGMVWVTSAFDQLSAPGLELPLTVPSESTMDSLSHAISARMEALGWQIPLYVWSLHPRAGKPEGRVVQATGCLLPAGCRTEGLAEQLSALAPELTSLGLQQTCGEVKHNFLL